MDPERHDSEREVWRRYLFAAQSERSPGDGGTGASGPDGVDFTLLAQFMDGRLDEDERRRVEVLLDEAPDARALLAALVLELPCEALIDVPERVQTRASMLVPAADRPRELSTTPDDEPVIAIIRPMVARLRRVAAAAAVLLVALAGWHLGSGTVGPSDPSGSANTATNSSGDDIAMEDRLAREMSFGLFATDEEFVIDTVLLAALERGS